MSAYRRRSSEQAATLRAWAPGAGLIAETKGRPDAWERLAAHRVKPRVAEVPPYALVDCHVGLASTASLTLAEAVSRELGARALGFAMQTAADVYYLHTFDAGRRVRALEYARDEGGWLRVEGAHQTWWEPAFFFGASASARASTSDLPDLLDDDVSPEDLARFEAAQKTGVPDAVFDLLHPSSMRPMRRVCEALGVTVDPAHAEWSRPSLLARWFGRG